MISYQKVGKGGEQYYRSLAREKNRLKNNEPLGRWYGEGARKLGLRDDVLEGEFSNLFRGLSPDGTVTLARKNKLENRVCGYDFTYSPPKSVSVFCGLGDENIQNAVQQELWESVRAGLNLFEKHAYSRSTFDGSLVKVDLVVAAFEDGTSRACDTQLHMHLMVLNLGVCPDKSIRKVESKLLLDVRRTVDTIINAEYAKRLEQSLGVEVERKGTWFEIKEVPKHIIDFFSKREQQITARLAETGIYTPQVIQRAVLETRVSKKDTPRAELMHIWRMEGKELGFTEQEIRLLCDRSVKRDEGREIEALLKATNLQLSKQPEGVFTENRLIREIATEAIGRGVGADEVIQLSNLYLNTKGITFVGSPRGQPLYRHTDAIQVEVSQSQDSRTMKAYRKAAESGTLIVGENKEDVWEAVVGHWQKNGGIYTPERNLAIIDTEVNTSMLNERFQKLRFEAGSVHGDCIGIKGGLCFEGDRIFFVQNSDTYGIASGDFGTVTEIDKTNNRISIILNNHSMESIPIKFSSLDDGYKAKYIQLGYAIKGSFATKTASISAQNIYVASTETLHKNQIAYIQGNSNVTVYTTRNNAGDRLRDISLNVMQKRDKQPSEGAREFVIEMK